MTIGRLNGDKIVARWGGGQVRLTGGATAALGFFSVVAAPTPSLALALARFALIGFGAANIVPVLFSAAGRQRDVSASLAINAITTIGYAGILAGPVLIGLVAHVSSLRIAFCVLKRKKRHRGTIRMAPCRTTLGTTPAQRRFGLSGKRSFALREPSPSRSASIRLRTPSLSRSRS